MTTRSSVDDEQHARQCRLEAICAAGERVEVDLPGDRAAYLTHYYAQADVEELARDAEMLARAALGHLAWARSRKSGAPLIRVFNPTSARDGWTSEHTVVETVNDDMPFLVDSLGMTLAGMNHPIYVTIHPMLHVERSDKGVLVSLQYARGGDVDGPARAESFIHIEIARETDAAILAAIEAGLASTLRAVRAAVEDWHKMLERLRAAASDLRATGGQIGRASCRERVYACV